jgi:hypothetical protein
MKLTLLLALLVVALAGPAISSGNDPRHKAEAILHAADARVASLHDFKANLQARARLSLLPALDLSGHVYFKRPNHFKVDVENLPPMLSRLRQQMQVEPPYQNRKKYTPRWVREEKLEGRMCDVIAFEAREPSTRLQTATIWLERVSQTIPRTVLDYSDGGHTVMLTTYCKVQGFMLPRHSDVEAEVSALHVTADVDYSGYVLNSNLPDSVFSRQTL